MFASMDNYDKEMSDKMLLNYLSGMITAFDQVNTMYSVKYELQTANLLSKLKIVSYLVITNWMRSSQQNDV